MDDFILYVYLQCDTKFTGVGIMKMTMMTTHGIGRKKQIKIMIFNELKILNQNIDEYSIWFVYMFCIFYHEQMYVNKMNVLYQK